MSETTIRFCGLGGQGIILSAVVLGTAAVEYGGKRGAQTQSYGAAARGGECKSDLILSDKEITSPIADKADILVVMSQQAYDRYIDSLKSGGLLIIDPEMVTTLKERNDVKSIEVPATKTAFEKIKNKITANMIMLGFLQDFAGLTSEENLKRAIKNLIPEKFLEADLKAVEEGIKISKNVKR